MPTVTAIALETLLEPGSSSSGSQHSRGHGIGNPPPSRPYSSKENHSRRHGARGGSSAASSSLKEHHRHQPGVRREQQPIFLSRRPREESEVSVPADRNDGPAQAAGSRAKSAANGYYISPQLYATPEPTLIVPTGGISSSSPTSVSSPSPYVVNHKRRDVPRLPPPLPSTTDEKAGTFPSVHLEGSDSATKAPNSTMEVTVRELTNGTLGDRSGEQKDEKGLRKAEDEHNSSDLRSSSGGRAEKECPDASIDDDIEDNFFDPRELMSTVSSSDTEDGGSVLRSGSGRCHTPLASLSEFYDANEGLLSHPMAFFPLSHCLPPLSASQPIIVPLLCACLSFSLPNFLFFEEMFVYVHYTLVLIYVSDLCSNASIRLCEALRRCSLVQKSLAR